MLGLVLEIQVPQDLSADQVVISVHNYHDFLFFTVLMSGSVYVFQSLLVL